MYFCFNIYKKNIILKLFFFGFDEIDIFPFKKKKKTVVVSVRDQRDQNQNYISKIISGQCLVMLFISGL